MYVMKIKLFHFLLAVLTLPALTSCDDIIAKNISEDKPEIIMPQTGSTIDENPVHFKWEALAGATKYRVQIVSPSFSDIQIYAVDSIVPTTDFYIPLDSNSYELRITAINAGYESQPSDIVSFTVGTSSGSGSGTVSLLTPENNKYIGSTSVLFKWNSVSDLQSYTFELHSGPTFADPFTISPEQLAAVQINVNDLPEGTYSWGVKAYLTDGTETQFTKRVFFIDTTDPGVVTLLSPSNNSTFQTALMDLTWNAANPGPVQSEITYTVEISRNSTFTDLVIEPAPETTEMSYTFQGITEDVYYWRIRTVDAAGNTGPVSPVYTFTKTF
jgi:hypothetical protein